MRGGQWQALYLMRGLREAGHDCALLAPAGSPLSKHAATDGFDARRLGLPRLWRLGRRADIVHAHTGRAHALAALAGAPRLVVSRRVAFPVQRGWASRWKYSRAARFIAVSEHVRQALLEADIAGERISVVYDGVPLLEQARPSRRVIAPATDDPRKGSRLVREAAERAGVEVHFSSNLAAELREAGLFVYVTEQEGLGSGALLAMAAGVPVVASRVGGLEEVVEHGVTGLLADNDPETLASSIRTLLEDRATAAEFGRRARERIKQRFSLEEMVNGTLNVYREVLGC